LAGTTDKSPYGVSPSAVLAQVEGPALGERPGVESVHGVHQVRGVGAVFDNHRIGALDGAGGAVIPFQEVEEGLLVPPLRMVRPVAGPEIESA